ncbi:hypothetical protein GCM10007382_18360 [Salinibacterium xinjiangense]|nr:hypothetical protein GCM10007382_18360 [Salinibacterium xinjiangense]
MPQLVVTQGELSSCTNLRVEHTSQEYVSPWSRVTSVLEEETPFSKRTPWVALAAWAISTDQRRHLNREPCISGQVPRGGGDSASPGFDDTDGGRATTHPVAKVSRRYDG